MAWWEGLRDSSVQLCNLNQALLSHELPSGGQEKDSTEQSTLFTELEVLPRVNWVGVCVEAGGDSNRGGDDQGKGEGDERVRMSKGWVNQVAICSC